MVWTGIKEGSCLGCHLKNALAHGYAVASVDYRLARDGHSGRDMLDDVVTGVHAVRRRAARSGAPTQLPKVEATCCGPWPCSPSTRAK